MAPAIPMSQPLLVSQFQRLLQPIKKTHERCCNRISRLCHCPREASLRTACLPDISLEVMSNFEINSFHGCPNPHLGLPSIVDAGLDDIMRNFSLPKHIVSSHQPLLRLIYKRWDSPILQTAGFARTDDI